MSDFSVGFIFKSLENDESAYQMSNIYIVEGLNFKNW